jgi:hypothetical protein
MGADVPSDVDRDPHEAYRLVWGSAARAGDSRDRHADIDAESVSDAARHLDRNLFAHGAVTLQRLGAHTE